MVKKVKRKKPTRKSKEAKEADRVTRTWLNALDRVRDEVAELRARVQQLETKNLPKANVDDLNEESHAA